MTNSETRTQLEVFKFYLALYGFHNKGGSEKTFLAGASTLKRYVELRNGVIRDFLSPLAERGYPAFNTLPNKLSRALKGAVTNPDQVLALGSIFYDVCVFYKSRSNLIREISDRKSRDILSTCVYACYDEQVSLSMLLTAPPSRLKLPNRWIKKASLQLEEVSQVEIHLNELKEVQVISEEIRSLNLKINSDTITDQERAVLISLREKKMKSLQKTSEEISSESPAIAVASSIINSPEEHKTKVGQEQKLTPTQEDIILSKGETSVQAGAGVGKTKVVASKVAYTVKELDVSPENMIVVSTSKDTADNLRQRIVKYGGEESMGRFVGVSTEAVAFSIVKDLGIIADKEIIKDETLEEWVKLAVDLVIQGDGSKDSPNQPLLKGVELDPESSEDPRLTPLLIRVVSTIARKAVKENSKELLSLVAPAISTYSKGKIKLAPRSSEVWLDKDFRSSINQHIKSSGGKEDLSQSSPYEGFQRFASESAKPKPIKVSNQWFNLGMDPLHNTHEANLSQFTIFIKENKKKMVSASSLWEKRKKSAPLDLTSLKDMVDYDMKVAVYGAYEYAKEKQGAIDQEDFSILACRALVDRPALLKEMNSKYTHILIDEAQDLSGADKMMFRLISGSVDTKTLEPKQMTSSNFFTIGDRNQRTKNASRNASKNKVLSTNMRSRSNIIEAANKIISAEESACRPNPMKEGGEISYSIHKDLRSPGADFLAKEVKEQVEVEGWGHEGGENHKFGIAVRSSKEMVAYAVELMLENVPYYANRDFLDETPIKAVLSAIGLRSPNPTHVQESILNLHKYLQLDLGGDFNNKLTREAGGESLLSWLLVQELDEGALSDKETEYVSMIKSVLDFEGDTLSLLNFVTKSLKASEGKTLMELRVSFLTPAELFMLKEEIGGGTVSAYNKAEFSQSGFDVIYRVFEYCDFDLEKSFRKIESLQKVSKMYSKDKNKDRVLIRLCKDWKGRECRDLYVAMSPTYFPRMGEDIREEETLAYLALTRAQEKVHILCGDYPSSFVKKACVLSKEEFMAQSKESKPTLTKESSVDSMIKWLSSNESV
jgi:superfamily I DNA/RNA helicase